MDSVVQTQNNVPVPLRPDKPHLGPVQLELGVYTGVEFDDNINTSQNDPQSDTIIHAGVNLGLDWLATEQSELRLTSDVGYATYLAHSRDDTVEIAPGSAATWSVSFEDGSVAFFDQFNYSQAVITVASIRGVSRLPRFDNTVGARAQWLPERWQFELGYSHNNFLSTDSAFQYLNRSSEYFFARGARRFAEHTQIGLEASTSLTAYELPIQSDNTSYSLGPYAEWKVTQFLSASLRGGPTIYAFDAVGARQPSRNLVSYYANLNLTHSLTEFVSQQLSIGRAVNLGYNQGNDFTEQLTSGYSVHWAAREHLDGGLNFIYEHGQQPLNGQFIPVTENFDRFGIISSVSYQFTRKLSGTLNCSHWERRSNLPGNNYGENNVALQVHYAF